MSEKIDVVVRVGRESYTFYLDNQVIMKQKMVIDALKSKIAKQADAIRQLEGKADMPTVHTWVAGGRFDEVKRMLADAEAKILELQAELLAKEEECDRDHILDSEGPAMEQIRLDIRRFRERND